MKKLIYLVTALLVILSITACSEKDPNHNPVLGYKLDQFITPAAVSAVVDPAGETDDYRSLFAYEIVSGEDGFSPRSSVNAGYDLPWNLFSGGYLVPSDDFRTWFPNANLPGAFKVKKTGIFRLYRKVDVHAGLRSSKMVELHGLIKYPTSNWVSGTEDAVKLADLLQGIAEYDSVALVAVDGYTKTYLPEHVDDGYYLLNSEVTTFPTFNDTFPNSLKKFKKLATIEVYGATSGQDQDFDLAPQDTANLVVPVPSNLSGFESSELSSE